MDTNSRIDIKKHGYDYELTFDMPEAQRARATFFGTIVSAATAWPVADSALESTVQCRRQSNVAPCPGLLRIVRNDDKEEIRWACTTCGDSGLITGWRDTEWNLTDALAEFFPREDSFDVVLSPEEHGTLLQLPPYDDAALRTILAAQAEPGNIRLRGRADELEALRDLVADQALQVSSGRRRDVLDSAFDKIEAAL